jgi:hypothetical protein
MEKYVLLMDSLKMKEELKYVMMECGVAYVMMDGIKLMLTLSALN